MNRYFALIAMFVLVPASGCDTSESIEDRADELLDLGSRNAFLSDEFWTNYSRAICTPTKIDVCADQGCERRDLDEPPITITWEISSNEYLRCDEAGCDKYKPAISHSGMFTNIALPDNGTTLRITSSGQYTETAASMLDIYVYRGNCELVAQ